VLAGRPGNPSNPMPRRFRILILTALSLAAAATAGLWALMILAPVPQITRSGTAAIGGPFTLVDTDGATVTDRSYPGKWRLIFFGYTFCPDACPTTLHNMSVALEKLGSDAGKLQPIFITVDPRRDTREVMADYLKSFDSRIVGLTGTQAQIDSIVKEYRVYVGQEKAETTGDDYLVFHSSYIYLMDPRRTFVDVISGAEPGEEIAAWLRKHLARAKG